MTRWIHALALLSFLALLAAPASAQSQPFNLHNYEIGVEVSGCAVTMTLTDALTGTFYFESDIFETGSSPDFEVDTNEQNPGELDEDLPMGKIYLLKFAVSDTPPMPNMPECPITSGSTANYVWSNLSDQNPDGVFYQPEHDRYVDTYFRVSAQGMQIRSIDSVPNTGVPIEDALGYGSWTLPYDIDTYCQLASCNTTSYPYSQFVARGVALRPDGTVAPEYTFAGDVTLEANQGAQTWDVPGLELSFAPGAKLVTDGTLDIDGATLTASDPASGWGGIRFEPGADGVLTDATVEQVRGFGGASVYAHDASVWLDGTTIEKPQGAGMTGLYLSGGDPTTDHHVTNGSVIRDHPGDGIRAISGAEVYVEDSDILNNGDGLSALNASVFTYNSEVDQQTHYGTEATHFGNVVFGFPFSGYPTGSGVNNVVQESAGGDLRATSYAAISAGDQSSFRNNSILRGSSGLHAYARTDSDVTAQYDWWGTTAGPDLAFVDTDATSGFFFCPFLKTPGGTETSSDCGGGPLPKNSTAKGPSSETTSVEAGPLAAAREALNAGDAAGAVAEALALGQTSRDAATQRSAAVLLALAAHRDRSAPAIAALEALALPGHPARHVALRALASVHTARGETEAAQSASDRLLRHAAHDESAAHALRALVELERDRPVAARAALAQAERSLAGAREGDAALVEAARAEIALREGTTDEPTGITEPAESPGASAKTDAGADAVALSEPRPNPSRGAVEADLTLPADADVEAVVYDALGRRVVRLANGTLGEGRHALSTAGTRLAPGVYVLRVQVQSVAGPETLARTFTVVR